MLHTFEKYAFCVELLPVNTNKHKEIFLKYVPHTQVPDM